MNRQEMLREWLWRTKILDKTKSDRLLTIKDYADLVFIFDRVEEDLLEKFKKCLEECDNGRIMIVYQWDELTKELKSFSKELKDDKG